MSSKKEYAQNRNQTRMDNGSLPKIRSQKCLDCGKKAAHYHHENHNDPDKVVPLCVSCHMKRTYKLGERKPITRRKRTRIGPLTKWGKFLSPSAICRAYRKRKYGS